MLFRLLLSGAATIATLASLILGAAAQDRIAVVIGNRNYAKEVGTLTNPHHDIDLVKTALERLGFSVLPPVKDATRKQIISSTKRLAEKLRAAGPGAIGVLYYSGHGFANPDTRTNYLIPVDLKEIADDDAWIDAVKLDELLFELSTTAREARRFVLLDACRTELRLPYKAVAVGLGFEQPLDITGMFLGFSTAPGAVASDKGDKGGPYAKALAAEILVPGLSHAQIFQNIKEKVHDATKGKQTPFESNGIVKGVVFRDVVQNEAAKRLKQAEYLWQQIKNTDNIALLNAFIEAFPEAPEADLARALRGQILAPRVSEVLIADLPWTKSPQEKFEQATGSVVTVLYATNRSPTLGGAVKFGPQRAQEISYGFARVRSPELRSLDRRSTEAITILGQNELFLNVGRQFAQATSRQGREALIYIPGFNLEFDEAVGRAARVARELDFRGLPFVFSWPSSGKSFSFIRDLENATQSASEIGELIRLVRMSGADRVHILAEGFGARPLLSLIARGRESLGVGAPIGQLVFVGPDVDQEYFMQSVRRAEGVSERITLYVSTTDAALQASRYVSQRPSAGGQVTLVPGVDTIDASGLAQSWFSLNPLTVASQAAVVRDIAELVRNGSPPAIRSGLVRLEQPNGVVWQIRPPTP